jgi:16S rRNA (uracil1498-N3)-methyltransferase
VGALTQLTVEDPAHPVLSRDAHHHLRAVLRARDGEEVVVSDGRGAWSFCEVTASGLTRVSEVVVDPAPPATTLYLAPLKGDRAERSVAHATELGVGTIVPLLSERVVVHWRGEARDKVLARWRRIAREACGQCRRTYFPVVADPVEVARVPGDVAVADPAGDPDWSGCASVAVGPEGGWAPDEWGPQRRRLSLGPTVLRADTAAVVAAALVAFAAGGWGFSLRGSRSDKDEGTT